MERPHYVATSKHFGQRRPSAPSFLSPLLRQDVCFVMIVIGPADHAPFLFILVSFFSSSFFPHSCLQDILNPTGDVLCVCECVCVLCVYV